MYFQSRALYDIIVMGGVADLGLICGVQSRVAELGVKLQS